MPAEALMPEKGRSWFPSGVGLHPASTSSVTSRSWADSMRTVSGSTKI